MVFTPSSCCFEPGRSISRILLSIDIANASDHLSGLQVTLQLKQPTRNSTRASRSRPIASNEIRPCLALLLVGVAWPPTLLLTPVVSYNVIAEQSRTNSTSELAHLCTLTRLNKFKTECVQLGGLFLWPGPAGFPAPGVTRHRALWSADFPQPNELGRGHPTNLVSESYLDCQQASIHVCVIVIEMY